RNLHLAVKDLRVLEDLVHAADRPAREAGLLEAIDPVLSRVTPREIRDQLDELSAMSESVDVRGKPRIVGQTGHARKRAQATELLVVVRPDDHVPVVRGEHLV